jgi:hypothetical protein
MVLKLVVVLLLLLALFIGCSKDSSVMEATVSQPVLIVTPADGQGDVRLDAGISLAFAKPVDRRTVEDNFHLINETSMADSLCPLDTTMGHGVMTMTMMDSVKMDHVMSWHATRGRFYWSGDNTGCTFAPDSMMAPRTRYMIHLDGQIMRMVREQMDGMNMGSMGGHDVAMGDDMVFHFVTMDTTGGGHWGHH